MSHSDLSDTNEEIGRREHHQKSKRMNEKHKKRKRSNSKESNTSGVRKQKKYKSKRDSEYDSDNGRKSYKHKSKNFRRENQEETYSEKRKINRYYSNEEIELQSEKDGKRSGSKRRRQKEENTHLKSGSINEAAEKYDKKDNNSSRYKSRSEKSSVVDKKEINTYSDQKNRYESDNENNCDERGQNKSYSSGTQNEEECNNDRSFRYWSNPRPIRKNSDSYWNKYSERLKEPTENLEVGPRYYSAPTQNSKKENTSKSNQQMDEKRLDDCRTENDDVQKKIPEEKAVSKDVPPKQSKTLDLLTSRTGGAYIPPAKLRMMQESITDKASAVYQRLAWEALKKSIQGHVNKVNVSNITVIVKAIMKENIVRGRGLVCRALIQAQAASPTFTNVYAAFVAALNAKFPKIGELLLKRLVVQFRRGFKRNDKTICITAATFIAHLVNQEVAHEIIALEILTLLIETPTDDSVEVAIAFLKECGMKLTEVSSKGVLAIFDMLRNILHEGKLEQRVQYMIEVMFQIRKEEFKAHPSLIKELDLVEEDDRIQHMITLEENHNPEDILNVFKIDPDYEANEAKYKSLVQEDSDDESGDEDGSGSDESGEDSDDEDEEKGADQSKSAIIDRTETNLVALRKTIYLTIQSSLDFEECAHKLLRMELKPGQEIEMAHMFLDCCAEQRTYEKFFGLLAQRFCQINRIYIGPFEETFRDSYATIHRMSNDKLRNVAKLFAHLLYTDAISWDVLATIKLNEDDTTSSSRIFIKILFLELSEYMGLAKLNQRVKDPALQTALEGLFPRDNPKHTRFAINFFTSIGLGGLTDELREHLKTQPKPSLAVPQLVEDLSSSSSSSSDSSSDSSDSSPDSSSSDSSSSDSEDTSKRKKKREKLADKNKKNPKRRKTPEPSKKRKSSSPKRKHKR